MLVTEAAAAQEKTKASPSESRRCRHCECFKRGLKSCDGTSTATARRRARTHNLLVCHLTVTPSTGLTVKRQEKRKSPCFTC